MILPTAKEIVGLGQELNLGPLLQKDEHSINHAIHHPYFNVLQYGFLGNHVEQLIQHYSCMVLEIPMGKKPLACEFESRCHPWVVE